MAGSCDRGTSGTGLAAAGTATTSGRASSAWMGNAGDRTIATVTCGGVSCREWQGGVPGAPVPWWCPIGAGIAAWAPTASSCPCDRHIRVHTMAGCAARNVTHSTSDAKRVRRERWWRRRPITIS